MAVLAVDGPGGRTLEPFDSFEEAAIAMDRQAGVLEAKGYRVKFLADATLAIGESDGYLFQVFD